jgi:hypothetical protein
VLASAEIDGCGFGGFELDGRVVGGLVAAIAKGLVGAQSASAPEVAFAGLYQNGIRAFLCNVRVRHRNFSLKVLTNETIIADSSFSTQLGRIIRSLNTLR